MTTTTNTIGCGKLTYAVGGRLTNGGKMRCGATLNHSDGTSNREYCGKCLERINTLAGSLFGRNHAGVPIPMLRMREITQAVLKVAQAVAPQQYSYAVDLVELEPVLAAEVAAVVERIRVAP